MARFWVRLGALAVVLPGLAGCGGSDEAVGLGQLEVVEVTTVTTVQGTGGVFLSPRPRQARPDYVASSASASAASAEPTLDESRAKVDSALLFRASESGRFELEATLPAVDAQHYFPEVLGSTWPIELLGDRTDASQAAWTEWEGWRAFAGLSVREAAAATLDYETTGLESPLVLSMADESMAEWPVETQALVVTNRSSQTIARALLVYSHAGGIGVKVVGQLPPGRSEMTATGPKERGADELLDEARSELTSFLSDDLGAELGQAAARAKSIPFLETHGLRLIYLLDEQQSPVAIGLPAELGGRRRVTIAQAEVLPWTEEARVLQVLADGALDPSDVPTELGRFARGKLEGARLNGSPDVQSEAQRLLQDLSE